MSDTSQGPGWWLASDGRWYAPTTRPGYGVQTLPTDSNGHNEPQAYGHQPGIAPGEANGFAIASLVLALLWFFGLGSLVAMIFALVALRQIKSGHRAERGNGSGLCRPHHWILWPDWCCGVLLGCEGLFADWHRTARTSEPCGAGRPLDSATSAQPPASNTQPLTTLPAATNTQNEVNPLGVTLNVANPSGVGFTKVLVGCTLRTPSPSVPCHLPLSAFGVCAGPDGSQTGPSSNSFVPGVKRGPRRAHVGRGDPQSEFQRLHRCRVVL